MKKKKYEEIIEYLQEVNPKAIIADGFDAAIIGTACRADISTIAVYDVGKILNILMKRDGMSEIDAIEFYGFNIVGTYVGENGPMFINTTF